MKKDFNKMYKINTQTGCWEFDGYLVNGYGRFYTKGKRWLAHRFFYTTFVSDIPEGLLICHQCDNRKCVNPKHLFLGTHKDNSQDMMNKNRISRRCTAKDHTHTSSKLSKKQVNTIRTTKKYSPFELAVKFKVSPVTISSCRSRRTYRDLP